VDRCIECGYCEHKCPSRDLTTTPRRRIVIRRELKKLQIAGDMKHYSVLLDQYKYDGMDTCAVDGLCAIACPVDINTGDLIKRLRRENHSPSANKMALWVAKNFTSIEWAVRAALKTGCAVNKIFGKHTMTKLTSGIKKIIPSMPLWSEQISYPPKLTAIKKNNTIEKTDAARTVVYFPSCLSRTLGTYQGKQKNGMETFLSICHKTGINVFVLQDTSGSCCSQIFSSKGFQDAYSYTANQIVDRLWKQSQQGVLPIVIDVSSCAYTLHHIRPVLNDENKSKFDQLSILDSVDFLHDLVLPFVQV
jgi:D-lactate dehydrogenase